MPEEPKYRIGQIVFLPDDTPIRIESINWEDEEVKYSWFSFFCPWRREVFEVRGPNVMQDWEMN